MKNTGQGRARPDWDCGLPVTTATETVPRSPCRPRAHVKVGARGRVAGDQGWGGGGGARKSPLNFSRRPNSRATLTAARTAASQTPSPASTPPARPLGRDVGNCPNSSLASRPLFASLCVSLTAGFHGNVHGYFLELSALGTGPSRAEGQLSRESASPGEGILGQGGGLGHLGSWRAFLFVPSEEFGCFTLKDPSLGELWDYFGDENSSIHMVGFFFPSPFCLKNCF